MNNFFPVLVLAALLMVGCGGTDDPYYDLREALTFYTSFDGTLEADYAAGDPAFYSASSWERRMEYERFDGQNRHMQIHEGEGRYGDALWVDSLHDPVFFYRGEENVPHDTENWSGTVSFWMRLDPAEAPAHVLAVRPARPGGRR